MSDETPEVQAESTPVGDAIAQAAAALEQMRGAARAQQPPAEDAPAAATEGEPAPAADDAQPEPIEAKVDDEASLKARLRGRLAEAKRAKEEAERIRQEAREEAERIRAEAAKGKGELEQLRELFRSNPDQFLEKAGWDLTEMVQAKLEEGKPEAKVTQLERKLQAVLERLEAKEKAETEAQEKARKEREESEHKAAVAKAEQEFLDGIKADAHPMLARMAKRNAFLTKAQAYSLAYQFREEHGRNPTNDEIYENIERTLSGLQSEDDETVTLKPAASTGKKPTPRAAAAPSPGAVDFSKLSDDEKTEYAEKELARMRLARSRASS